VVRRADSRGVAREAELLGQTAVCDVALHHHRVDVRGVDLGDRVFVHHAPVRNFGVLGADQREALGRVAVLVVCGELAAEARLAKVEIVQRAKAWRAQRAHALGKRDPDGGAASTSIVSVIPSG
jgi:hypothetical protein